MKAGLTLVASVGVVGALWFAWSAAQRTDAAQTQLATVTRQEQELATRVAAAQRRLHSAELQQSALQTALLNGDAELKRRKAAASAPTPTPLAQNAPAFAVLLDRNPKLLALYRAQFEAGARLRYAPFFRQEQLSPEQQQAFIALLDEQDQARLDVQDAAAAQLCAPNDPAIAELQKNNRAVVNQKFKTLLGDDRFAQLQQFQSFLEFDGDPVVAFTPDQAMRLSNVLAHAHALDGQGPGAQFDPESVIAAAKTFLSSAQVDGLHAMLVRGPVVALIHRYYAGQKPTSAPAGPGRTP